MKSIFSKEVFFHPIVLSAIGVALIIAAGSVVYYALATRKPAVTLQNNAATTTPVITGNGTVEPAQNPDLAFETGGRVARISVAVGDSVVRGEVLASLDTAALSAQRTQAVANLKSQQAKLDEMLAGPRQVDVDIKKTAVAQAQLALSNAYQNISSTLADTYGKSYDAVHTGTDTLFNNPNSSNPTLSFTGTNNQANTDTANQRVSVNAELAAWQKELSPLSALSPSDALESELDASLSHLLVLRGYMSGLLAALTSAVPSSTFSQSTISAALTSVGAQRNTVNDLVAGLQGDEQQVSAEKLAVQSAEDALNQTLAGATPQNIESQQAQADAARASIASVDAQLANATVVAPFAGTVASVHLKNGDIVAANTPAVSLNPKSALQIIVYFSEIEVTKVKPGASADVSLDAYGNSRIFPAQVISVDSSPSKTGSGSSTGYKATLQFLDTDPAISSGMTANVTIPLEP